MAKGLEFVDTLPKPKTGRKPLRVKHANLVEKLGLQEGQWALYKTLPPGQVYKVKKELTHPTVGLDVALRKNDRGVVQIYVRKPYAYQNRQTVITEGQSS